MSPAYAFPNITSDVPLVKWDSKATEAGKWWVVWGYPAMGMHV